MARDRDDEDDLPSIQNNRPLSGMDGLFANTSIVVLVIFSVCCSGIALILSLIGVFVCTDERAKSNARMVLIISGVVLVIGTITRGLTTMSQLTR